MLTGTSVKEINIKAVAAKRPHRLPIVLRTIDSNR